MKLRLWFFLLSTALFLSSGSVLAQEREHCPSIKFGSVGWVDAGAGSAVAGVLLTALGYKVSIQRYTTSVILASMKNRDIDVFMEAMVPTMGNELKPFILDGSIELITENLQGTKYTLAANKAASALGIQSFSDIAKHGEALNNKIYSTDTGSDGSQILARMIADKAFGLENFELVTLSERQLVLEARKLSDKQLPVVMLAFEPHPRNVLLDLSYLAGGDDYFGDNFGGADIYTGVRTGFVADCPNAVVLISRLQYELGMTNELMTYIMELKAKPEVAAMTWLRQNANQLKLWLKDVTTIDGAPALPATMSFLGLAGN